MKKMSMTQTIKTHLVNNNSYFKWGKERLAAKFGCSVKTITSVINNLKAEKVNYLRSLQN
jgi:biotin operon repressor